MLNALRAAREWATPALPPAGDLPWLTATGQLTAQDFVAAVLDAEPPVGSAGGGRGEASSAAAAAGTGVAGGDDGGGMGKGAAAAKDKKAPAPKKKGKGDFDDLDMTGIDLD
jgi:hypothetical protein